MTTEFHAKPLGRFMEIESNLRRKKLHRTNQGSNFLGGNFIKRVNVRAPIQLRGERQCQCQDDFSSRRDQSNFTSIVPVLLYWSNEISQVFPALKLISHFLPQAMLLRRSDPC